LSLDESKRPRGYEDAGRAVAPRSVDREHRAAGREREQEQDVPQQRVAGVQRPGIGVMKPSHAGERARSADAALVAEHQADREGDQADIE
jgi:hypothetical protein